LGKLESWSSEGLEDSRPNTDLLREVFGMPLEPPRFAISLWGSKDNTQISAGVVGLEGLVEESEGRQSSLEVEEKLAFADFEGDSFRRAHSWIRSSLI